MPVVNETLGKEKLIDKPRGKSVVPRVARRKDAIIRMGRPIIVLICLDAAAIAMNAAACAHEVAIQMR